MIVNQQGELEEELTMDAIQERTKALIEIVKQRKSIDYQRQQLLLEIGRLLDFHIDDRFFELFNQ